MPKSLITKRNTARRPIAAKPRPRPPTQAWQVVKPPKRGPKRWQSHAHDLIDQSGELFSQIKRTGSSLWALGSKISGHGDYKVNRNTLLTDSAPPTFGSGGGGIRIRHREYVRDIVSIGANFRLSRIDINPGDPHLFPFLSTIAKNFEQYRLNGMIFEYRPTGGFSVGTPNASMGVVNIATNYDVLDTPFGSKVAMDAYEFSSSDIPFQKIIHPIECARRDSPLSELYIAPLGTIPQTGDPRFYYFGSTYVATSGQQTAQTLGELWVSYDVTLLKPKISGVPDLMPVLGMSMPARLLAGTYPRFDAGAFNHNTTVGYTLSLDFTTLSVDLPPGLYSVLEWIYDQQPSIAFPALSFGNAVIEGTPSESIFTAVSPLPYARETMISVAAGVPPITITASSSAATRGAYRFRILPRGAMNNLIESSRPFVIDEIEEKAHPPTPSQEFVSVPRSCST